MVNLRIHRIMAVGLVALAVANAALGHWAVTLELTAGAFAIFALSSRR